MRVDREILVIVVGLVIGSVILSTTITKVNYVVDRYNVSAAEYMELGLCEPASSPNGSVLCKAVSFPESDGTYIRELSMQGQAVTFAISRLPGAYSDNEAGRYEIQLMKRQSVFESLVNEGHKEGDSLEIIVSQLRLLQELSNNRQQSNQNQNIDSVVATQPNASIAFNTPNEMTLSNDYHVVLLVSRLLSEEYLKESVDSLLSSKSMDSIETHRIKASPRIEAHLSGQSFSITTGTPVQQPIRESGYTTWEWQVQPTKEGVWHLFVTINLVIQLDDGPKTLTIQSYKREIKVRVESGFRTFLHDYEQFIVAFITAIVTVGCVFLAQWLGRPRTKKQKEEKQSVSSSPSEGMEPET